MSEALLDRKEVCKRIGFSHTFVYKEMREGRFPKHRKIGNRSRWLESEVDDWIRSQ
ncbi:AlpA family phage regulatory protein [Pseudomonas sp. SbB1]|uniref:Phage transcriptional regulator, AlpA n=1 Tax=Pseudomonas putida (strain GB-1) TaxID=76869 RepID=B0KSV2_PSEPG|nr:phage transcriptional regulator, AlpA [Pseudomonas putida GB-1]EKT4563208.1 AlpA family phage regulatory protein [Pseudomonas putida]MBP0707883.1 AlpA family phage regulatory protein [Pseudomonas sp. T34]NOG89999.1 AlpA family phage regulatory protein [Pseudomonas sp. SbB1]ELF6205139.1 AlpA family phage regulatory protein [Pseudomonas putida]